jgi:hypothetical protein
MFIVKSGENFSHSSLLESAEIFFKFSYGLSFTHSIHGISIVPPSGWSWGNHFIDSDEMELSENEKEVGDAISRHVAIYLCMVQVDKALQDLFPDRLVKENEIIYPAAHIARLIRNTFAHNPFNPVWDIKPECIGKTYEIKDVIKLDTTDLHKKPVKREDYGGPLAVLRFLQFVKGIVKKEEDSKK